MVGKTGFVGLQRGGPLNLHFLRLPGQDPDLYHESIHVQHALAVQPGTIISPDHAAVGQLMKSAYLYVMGSSIPAITADSQLSAARSLTVKLSEIDARFSTSQLIISSGNATFAELSTELNGMVDYWNALLRTLWGGVRADGMTTDTRGNPIRVLAVRLTGPVRQSIISYMRSVYNSLPPELDPMKDPVGIGVKQSDPAPSSNATKLRRPLLE